MLSAQAHTFTNSANKLQSLEHYVNDGIGGWTRAHAFFFSTPFSFVSVCSAYYVKYSWLNWNDWTYKLYLRFKFFSKLKCPELLQLKCCYFHWFSGNLCDVFLFHAKTPSNFAIHLDQFYKTFALKAFKIELSTL